MFQKIGERIIVKPFPVGRKLLSVKQQSKAEDNIELDVADFSVAKNILVALTTFVARDEPFVSALFESSILDAG